MARTSSCFWMGIVASVLAFGCTTALQAEETARAPQLPYELTKVRHIQAFVGSARAKDLLSRQGFVVTEEQFRQIFSPYLPAPRVKMPVFITVDSAWHTYHVLLEEGVQQVEMGQARLLRRFSERLYQIAVGRKGPSKVVYHDLAAFAAVGWAVQDSTCLQHLPADERAMVVRTLKAMETGAPALFFELPLQPENFRPAGFYTKTPELARYFVARRWYATSAFRLKSETETLRALYLTLLIESDLELKRLHRQLTTPPEAMVGPTDDPGVVQYAQLASKLATGSLTEEKIPRILSHFRREVSKLPGPRINDQFLLPEQFAARQEETKGMRVLGACQLPSAILFQKTTEPTIPKRFLPSGVDVFAAGPLACDAGCRALKAMESETATYEAVCRADCGPLPPSLHGRAMELLHLLHEPLPGTAPVALRTAVWQDKQLWTALGAWAEERHTWVLHAKPAGALGCMFEEPPGYVSPYPKFYRQLGQLARQAAAVLAQVTAEPDFATAGREWLKRRQPPAQEASAENTKVTAESLREMAENSDAVARMAQAMAEYFQTLGKDTAAASTLDRANAWEALDAAARRCVEDKDVTDNDRRCMSAFLRSPEGNAAQLLPEFATLCEQLATIADKELAGQPLDRKERRLITDYGTILARFHFYGGMTWLNPRDDFPCVAPVFDNPMRQKTLHVGVGRPEAIYVVLFNGKNLALHRGAVLSYREFPRKSGEGLDDDTWREEVNTSRAPSPPAWTASFRTTASKQDRAAIVREAAVQLREGRLDLEDFPMVGHEAVQVLIERLVQKWKDLETRRPPPEEERELSEEEQKAAAKAEEARKRSAQECSALYWIVLHHATDENVPDLLDRVFLAVPREGISDLSDCLRYLDWKPHRDKLVALAHHSRPARASCAAAILGDSPKDIDVVALAKAYAQRPAYLRGAYCYLIGRSIRPGPEGKRVLATGLRDESWNVRYQAAAAVSACRATSAEIQAGVRKGLEEKHPKVAPAMVHAAAALGLTDTAPKMLARLQKQVETSTCSAVGRRGSRSSLKDWRIESLTAELIAGLGEFRYRPAKDVLRAFIFPTSTSRAKYEFGSAAFKALLKIDPQEKQQLLSDIFQDPRCPEYLLQLAIVEVTETNDIKYVKTMLPLFEDVGRTATNGRQSQAVWAAWHITGILERADPRDPEESQLFEKIRAALLRQTHGSAAGSALSALKYFDPATAARECLSVALDRKMDKDARTTAIFLLREAPKPWPIHELLPLVDEVPEDNYTVLSIGYYAAQTVGLLSGRLDSTIPQEAETLRVVQGTFNAMLKGPRCEAAVAGLAHVSEDCPNVLLRIALDRSLPYATRTRVISVMSDYYGPEYAKGLIPLLSENTRPDDEQLTIALCAANAIARMVDKESRNDEESSTEFVRKARAWAETMESK